MGKNCSECANWHTNDRIAEKYDEGWGECKLCHEATFCDHCCMCFTPNNNEKEDENNNCQNHQMTKPC